MTQKEIDTLQALSNKREIEELTQEEKILRKELIEKYEEHDNAKHAAMQRASV